MFSGEGHLICVDFYTVEAMTWALYDAPGCRLPVSGHFCVWHLKGSLTHRHKEHCQCVGSAGLAHKKIQN